MGMLREAGLMSELASWTDEQLVPVFGNPGFDFHSKELITRRNPDVSRVVGRRVCDAEGAAACEAETWWHVCRYKGTFVPAGEGSARKWINAIADNAAIDWLRRVYNDRLPTVDWSVAPQPSATGAGPPAAAQAAEEGARVHEAVKRLPAELQAVLVLAKASGRDTVGLGEMSQQEVADLLGYSGPPTVHRRLKAAVAELRELLGVEPGDLP